MRCLQLGPEERMTSEDALQHPWFRLNNAVAPALQNEAILRSLNRVHITNQFKRFATSVVAKHVDHDSLLDYRHAFEKMNATCTGFIEYDQFMEAVMDVGWTRVEAQGIFEYFDFKQDGRICFVLNLSEPRCSSGQIYPIPN
mmetsp:Transcript_37020/g.52297  ORF Transcript_37020/g.52297 Transcript_37020/m.52297 type:complete len:142 (-) Transcript_37020:41-466(-)